MAMTIEDIWDIRTTTTTTTTIIETDRWLTATTTIVIRTDSDRTIDMPWAALVSRRGVGLVETTGGLEGAVRQGWAEFCLGGNGHVGCGANAKANGTLTIIYLYEHVLYIRLSVSVCVCVFSLSLFFFYYLFSATFSKDKQHFSER